MKSSITLLLGDAGSGKTSLAARYAEDRFTKAYAPTVGVEFYLKRTVLPGQRNVALKVVQRVPSSFYSRVYDGRAKRHATSIGGDAVPG